MNTTLEQSGGIWRGAFDAMAGPCEVLVDDQSRDAAACALNVAVAEATRIEAKYSRYRNDNVVHAINTSGGRPVTVDDETCGLLDYAARCHQLSDGLFDITSGVLRRAWRFDGSDRVPTRHQVARLMHLVGWRRVRWERPVITLRAGMEIDFGGIGKEYAVDRCLAAITAAIDAPVVVNFGGDLHASAPRHNGAGWNVGVEAHESPGRVIAMERGALATSGDARRYLLCDGVRYSHVLDPRTGWPVKGAPRSVTVLAATCTEAGLLATLALLQGAGAESFLQAQAAQYWCTR